MPTSLKSKSGSGVLLGEIVQLSNRQSDVDIGGQKFLRNGFITTNQDPSLPSFELGELWNTLTPRYISTVINKAVYSGQNWLILVGFTTIVRMDGPSHSTVVTATSGTQLGGPRCLATNGSGVVVAWTGGNGSNNIRHVSTDHGVTWTNTTIGLGGSGTPINDIEFANGTWIAVGGTTSGNFAIRSTDNMSTYTTVSLPSALHAARSIATNGTGTWLVGSAEGVVYRSTDDGLNWTTVVSNINSPLGTVNISEIVTNRSGVWIASTSGGRFRSTDNGTTWTKIQTQSFVQGDNVWWIGGSTWIAPLQKSTDNGVTWTSLASAGYLPLAPSYIFGNNSAYFLSNVSGATYELFKSVVGYGINLNVKLNPTTPLVDAIPNPDTYYVRYK